MNHQRVGHRVRRVSGSDLTEFATDTPNSPRHMAVVLRLDRPVPAGALIRALGQRASRVPRLRQRLLPVPPGLGRPVWVDDAAFDLYRHVRRRVSAEPRDEAVVLSIAAEAAARALPRDRPLWAVTLILDPAQGCHALALVVHHGLADGIGGLAALVALMDGGDPGSPSPSAAPGSASPPFPQPRPTVWDLLRDVTRTRIRALSGLAAELRRWRVGIAGFRAALPRRPAHRRRALGRPRRAPSPLNRPIGPGRRLAVARMPIRAAIDAAHRHRATVNDILLTAVGGALHRTLLARGEPVHDFVISVPVSARRHPDAGRLGNEVGVVPVTVPARGSALQRLRQVADATRAQGASARDDNSAAARGAVLRAAFRALAHLHLFGWFVARQRLVNTFVSNMHGPRAPLVLLGARIVEMVPISPLAGNVTVAFAALSYAGTLTVTVIADPDTCPDSAFLTAALQRELDAWTAEAAASSRTGPAPTVGAQDRGGF